MELPDIRATVEGEEDIVFESSSGCKYIQVKHSDSDDPRKIVSNQEFWDTFFAWVDIEESLNHAGNRSYEFLTTYPQTFEGNELTVPHSSFAENELTALMDQRIEAAKSRKAQPKYLQGFQDDVTRWKSISIEGRNKISSKEMLAKSPGSFDKLDHEIKTMLEKRVADPAKLELLFESVLGWWEKQRTGEAKVFRVAAASDLDQEIKRWMAAQTIQELGPTALSVVAKPPTDDAVQNCTDKYLEKARMVMAQSLAPSPTKLFQKLYMYYNFAQAYHMKLLAYSPALISDIDVYKDNVCLEVEGVCELNRLDAKSKDQDLIACSKLEEPLFDRAGQGTGALNHLRGVVQILSNEDRIEWE